MSEDQFDRLLLRLDVRDALGALTDHHREILELAYDEDLSQRQIAERLVLPLGTVKSRTHHALRALRRELQGRDLV